MGILPPIKKNEIRLVKLYLHLFKIQLEAFDTADGRTYTIRKIRLSSLKNENLMYFYPRTSTYGSIQERLVEQPNQQ